MLNQEQCNTLRDELFANWFDTTPPERVFRYLAVTPGGDGGAGATIHYAYAKPVWERGGCRVNPEEKVIQLVENTAFAGIKYGIAYYDYLRFGWPVAWALTAKDSFNDFPVLVLLERGDGSVVGALMRDSHMRDTSVAIAREAVEPAEVEALISRLQALQPGEAYGGFYMERSLATASLDEAIRTSPQTDGGQKTVIVYRAGEWFRGLWNDHEREDKVGRGGLHLGSMADFHDIPVSHHKRSTRKGLEVFDEKGVLPGDYACLKEAVALIRDIPAVSWDIGQYESHPAVKLLCDWWNTNGPADMRTAGCFRLYVWAEEDRYFQPGDGEEPVWMAEGLAELGPIALFTADDGPTVVAVFLQSRTTNTVSPRGWAVVHQADGSVFWEISEALDEVDEAYYSLQGLRLVAEHVGL